MEKEILNNNLSPNSPHSLTYIDDKGRKLFVSAGLGGNEYGTFYSNNNNISLHRVKSPSMPMVKSFDEAQNNLDTYAEKNKFTVDNEQTSICDDCNNFGDPCKEKKKDDNCWAYDKKNNEGEPIKKTDFQVRNVSSFGVRFKDGYYIDEFMVDIEQQQVNVKRSSEIGKIDIYDMDYNYIGTAAKNNGPTNGPSKLNDYKKKQNKGKTFYTKCGMEFKKKTNASVTAFEDLTDKCNDCPFREIKSRVVMNGTKEVIQCQAGECIPNHKNEYYTSSINDFNTLTVRSLDWNFLMNVKGYAKSLESVDYIDFHALDLNDCRKNLTISFNKNKSGILAKNQIIQKFFSE